MPVSRRTPIASYITMIATIRDMAKEKLAEPYSRYVAVTRAHTVAEWELGIPPLPTRRSATNFLVKSRWINVLRIWAISQPSAAAKKILFSSNPVKNSMFVSDLISQAMPAMLFPRAMSQVPCLHRHSANAMWVSAPVACGGAADLPCTLYTNPGRISSPENGFFSVLKTRRKYVNIFVPKRGATM